MELSQFDYQLPEELIAQQPAAERDGARMLVIDRKAGTWADHRFADIVSFVQPGDLFILNNSRVFPSRLIGNRKGHSGRAEVFLIEKLAARWRALVRPGKKLVPGVIVEIGPGLDVLIEEHLPNGERIVSLQAGDEWAAIQRFGHVPLPPYIRRDDTGQDTERYQTVFAKEPGSVAAPTAGLHFTEQILSRLDWAEVTLHVGLGTFQPLVHSTVEVNHLHQERYWVPPETERKLATANRVIAVGTTSVRTLESHARWNNAGETNLFIYPGFSFQRVNAMVTNFHLPQSSLLLLTAAFAGTELILDAYRHAVRERYRFFSYGDCMLIL